jgi:hypothetical protein
MDLLEVSVYCLLEPVGISRASLPPENPIIRIPKPDRTPKGYHVQVVPYFVRVINHVNVGKHYSIDTPMQGDAVS